jgi:hypothetical protein
VVFLARCLAGVCGEVSWMMCRCTGTPMHALDALRGQVASYRRGWPAVHGRSRGFQLQGKDPLVRDGAGGEVTGLGTVGGVLPRLGWPRWPWRRCRRRGVLRV